MEKSFDAKAFQYEKRAELVELLRRDFIGPVGGEDEQLPLQDRPVIRYMTGMLAPKNTERSAESDEEAAEDTMFDDQRPTGENDVDDEQEDDGIIKTSLLRSSFGFTCFAAPDTKVLKLSAKWGHYIKPSKKELLDGEEVMWNRFQRGGELEIDLAQGDQQSLHPDLSQPLVTASVKIRKPNKERNYYSVTCFLRNQHERVDKNNDTQWLFQVELSISGAAGDAPFVSPRILHTQRSEEDRIMEMAMRKYCNFAQGHSIGVDWEGADGDPTRAKRIFTDAMPSYEVPKTVVPTTQDNPAFASIDLSMDFFATAERADVAKNLYALCDAYSDWQGAEADKLTSPNHLLTGFQAEGEAALAKMADAVARMREGVATLEQDDKAWEAFQFMSLAMKEQRFATNLLEKQATKPDLKRKDHTLSDTASFRPFQIAFILLGIPSIADPSHPDREAGNMAAVADLLWFPTGGGKTEAYLGLTAFTLAIRRLQGDLGGLDSKHGVAVIMRYTLRLLTKDQFRRGLTLICAMEVERRRAIAAGDERWGAEPFRIGMWVGMKTTPNSITKAHEAAKYNESAARELCHLSACPYCGTPLPEGNKAISVEDVGKGRGRMLTHCQDPTNVCPFSKGGEEEHVDHPEGIPAMFIDEELYHFLPGLIVATVDKFAQLPWRQEPGAFFGKVTQHCERHGFMMEGNKRCGAETHNPKGKWGKIKKKKCNELRPPDLIIQDEFHLISGPLGSMVGLYETVIDALSEWEYEGKKVRPKVIASSATVRRAGEQLRGVFNREAKVFPPTGLDIEGNFFSIQRTPTPEEAGRLYVGICVPGRKIALPVRRTYTTTLAAAEKIFQDNIKHSGHVDPFMTLVGYFNSLKDLGGTRRMVEDAVRANLRQAAERDLASRRLFIGSTVKELTSRVNTRQLNEIRTMLDRTFTVENHPDYQSGDSRVGDWPIDVLLATNMISVGLDIARLGLMVVAKQPKSTAEYIQATSRVGRASPGVVLTIHNWARPRDLSHYEQFRHFHATFYKEVEGLSVTPFSVGAVHRGLSALLVSLVRNRMRPLSPNKGARLISDEEVAAKAEELTGEILQRFEALVAADVQQDISADEFRELLLKRVNSWCQHETDAASDLPLSYQGTSNKSTALLERPSSKPWGDFTCLQSLRDVEASSPLKIVDPSAEAFFIEG